jgi:hypothetical protein
MTPFYHGCSAPSPASTFFPRVLAKSANISAIAGTNWGDITGRNGGDRTFFQSLKIHASKTFSCLLSVDKVEHVEAKTQPVCVGAPERLCHGWLPHLF